MLSPQQLGTLQAWYWFQHSQQSMQQQTCLAERKMNEKGKQLNV
jgi:hypothetical protein